MSELNVILRINVIEAKNLAAKDRNGFSDPFVTINIDDSTYQTHVVNKNLNPKWDAIFDHKVDLNKSPSEIHFTCWDKDVFGRDYLGEIFVSLDKLWENNGHISFDDEFNLPQWYSLTTTRKNEDVSGQILIKIGLRDKDNKSLDAREWNSIWRKMNNLSINEEQSQPAASSTVRPSHERHSSLSTLSDIVGVIFLEIVCAIDLPAERNMTGLGFDMDPFVIVSFAKNTFRTKIINHNLNPEWNEKLHFSVKKQECDFQIKFSIYDWDKFSQNDHIASKLYDVRPLIERGIASMKSAREFDNMEDGLLEEVLTLEVHSKLANKHDSKLVIRTKFIPYEQLRKQFWYALAKFYDSDGNNLLNYVELETMLQSLGSTLSQETINSFYTRFGKDPKRHALKFDELVSCLEQYLGDASFSHHSANLDGEEADNEHLIYLQNCPICNRPNLDQLTETNIITHVAMCASSDWGNIDKFVTGDFVTESQAQRKWVSKVITKVGFGGYKIGGNNANIIVQDRKSGQLVEEKMAAYVRLGIRLLYRGVGSIDSASAKKLLESMSIKQGKKFNHPSSVADIKPFIKFHKLNIDEIADPLDSFKNFNEFFYRKLKPGARPCDSPQDPHVLVSPADCRMMAFPTVTKATELWIKGQSFSIARLLDDDLIAKEYEGGSLGIFRLAPQDYHRFHFPVEGELGPVKDIPGAYFTVNPMAIRSPLDVYGENKRAVCYINSPQFGKVAYITIGAMMVGSILFTSTPKSYVRRTDEHGYFAFGGSTVILLFQKGKMIWDEDLLANSKTCLETLVSIQ
ncbi:phosphatidylserine decarboxylase-domain-containing protein [Glomus cerebriforme]|uniref:Phosphatidylserine decarboxylase proenzyme 2 n=1 Tax=Glomus cerebriforme TaxID=658196 RepID=A0A397SET4_9GLOM|nr:phosphatidylserine decarboxylase-domain-containing protein [Glomus cerebriforme]